MTATFRDGLFRSANYEEGDDAANALQIYRAKQGRERLGNYSRWGFHHPGPAFFYVYAFGEWLLHDVTHVSPTPHNAHIYTGALLQLAFYAAAVALLARHSRQPSLAIALAIAFGALHYAHVDRILYSVWPPDVLLMPMLCFTVAAAAVSAGDRTALPILVTAGGFLVHGHIVQPMFVLPMGIAALIAAHRRLPGGLRATITTGTGRFCLALVALFLLPIVVDLFGGGASNAHDVWLHLKYQTDHGKTLLKSLLCYGSFFIGMNDPSMFNRLSDTTHVPFVERAWLLAAWFSVLGASAWLFFRRKGRKPSRTDLAFGRRLLGFWAAASVLTLVWGMRQDGGFTNFNSHFDHSLVHVIAFAGIVALTHVLPRTSPAFGWWLAGAAVPVFVLAVPYRIPVDTRGTQVAARLRGLLDADPKPAAPKLIAFRSDEDPVQWYEAVTLARAFQRLGIPFYVSPDWRIMFGDDKGFTNQGDVLHRGGLSVWQVVGRKAAPPGAHVLNQESSIVFVPPPRLERLPLHIECSSARETPFALFGLAPAEGDWAWTNAHVVAFEFTAPPTDRNLELVLDASGLTARPHPTEQRVAIYVNGVRIGADRFGEERRVARLPVPRDAWNARTPCLIVLDLPDATPPARVADSDDRRILGLRIHALKVGVTAE